MHTSEYAPSLAYERYEEIMRAKIYTLMQFNFIGILQHFFQRTYDIHKYVVNRK